MNIDERISELQEFIDGISSHIETLTQDQAIQNNLFLYRSFLIMIKELYELHADRKLLVKALTLALETDQEKNRDRAEIHEVMSQLHGEIHRVYKELNELKTSVEDLVK